MCLQCTTGLAVMKKVNLERHYNTHPMLHSLEGQVRKDNIAALHKGLSKSQAMFTQARATGENVVRRSYVVFDVILPVWPSVGVINLQMALDRKKVPHP